jgi:hypothetical protein
MLLFSVCASREKSLWIQLIICCLDANMRTYFILSMKRFPLQTECELRATLNRERSWNETDAFAHFNYSELDWQLSAFNQKLQNIVYAPLTVHLVLYSVMNQHHSLLIFTLFSYHASPCFAPIFSPSSGSRIYIRGVTAVLRSIPKEAFADSFQKLYERC